MSIVGFSYKGVQTKIQCLETEKMEDILKRFGTKTETDINNLYFMYSGIRIDKELKYKDIINKTDKERNEINLLVEEYNKEEIKENNIISKEIICPECKENIFININDYKIDLNRCKNGHQFYNISTIQVLYNG